MSFYMQVLNGGVCCEYGLIVRPSPPEYAVIGLPSLQTAETAVVSEGDEENREPECHHSCPHLSHSTQGQ